MIISGVGGQGVLLVTRIFAAFALQEGFPIIGSEDHGMSQRGGSVMTHLKIGQFHAPLVKKGDADILLSLEKNEAYKTLPYLRRSLDEKKGGLCFINAPDIGYMKPEIREYLKNAGIEAHVFDADRLATSMGMIQSTNIALISFATAHPRFPFTCEKHRAAVERAPPPRFLEISLKVFDHGFLEGKRQFASGANHI